MIGANELACKLRKISCMKEPGDIAKKWREDHDLTPRAVAQRIGTTRQSIENFEQGHTRQPHFILKLAELMGYQNPADLLAGKSPPPPGKGVDQIVTLNPSNMLPKLTTEIDVIEGRVNATVFRLLVSDDSGGADYPRGSHIIWSTTRRADFGRIVLVMDGHKQLHIRRKVQGRTPDRWRADPLHPSFAALDSVEDALSLKGVFDGYQLPPD